MSSTGQWRQAMALFDQWLDAGPTEAQALLDRTTQDDPALHERLLALVKADRAAQSQDFLGEGPAALTVPADTGSFAGQRLGAWVLHEMIGQGGMSQVWRATRDDGLYQGQAAVKLLLHAGRHGKAADAARDARFAREGELLARMQHPNIAQLLDAGFSPDGQRYLVLEYVAGERIDQWCDARQLGIEARLGLCGQVCDAVSYAHTHLVIHRDLKPGNILVNESGRVKLLDFGVAKLLDEAGLGGDAELSREAAAGLTPEYAAPEQVQGKPVTTATDVYALGVLLFVLLSGSRPFAKRSQGNAAALARAIVETAPRRLSQSLDDDNDAAAAAALRGLPDPPALARRLQGDLETIVAKAMKKAPQERYPTVQALHDDLLRHLRDEPVSARPDGWRYRSAKFVRRHRFQVLALGGLLLSLVGGIAATTWSLRAAQLETQRTRAVLNTLTRIFTDLTPDQTGQAQVSVVELLRRGWRQAEQELGRDPVLRAELGRPLGLMLKASGEMALAERALSLSHEQLAATGQRHTPQFLQVTLELGYVSQRLGRNERAAELFRQVMAAGSGMQPRPAEALQAQALLGALARAQGQLEAARRLLETAADESRRLFGEASASHLLALQELADVAREQGRWDETRRLLGRVAQLFDQAPKVTPAERHAARMNSATLDVELGRYLDASRQLRPLLDDMSRLYGPADTYTLYTATWLAVALFHLGDAAASDAVLAPALAAARASPEPDVRHELQIVMARHLIRRGRCTEALPMVQESLTYFDTGAPGHAGHAERSRLLVGECQLRQGLAAQALATLTQTREHQLAQHPGPHLDRWPTHLLLALALAETGVADAARAEADKALAIAEALLPPAHPDRERLRAASAQLNWRLAPSDATRAVLQQAVDRYARALAPRADLPVFSVLVEEPPFQRSAAGRVKQPPADPRFQLLSF